MKRYKRIPKKSPKQREIEATEDVLRELLRLKRGNKCEVCGRPNPGLFHILRKGTYPRMRFHRHNILLVCWKPCHDAWHTHRTDSEAGKRVQAKIIELRGGTYEAELKALNVIQPKLDPALTRILLKQELDELNRTLSTSAILRIKE